MENELVPIDEEGKALPVINKPTIETKLDKDLLYARENMEEMAKIGIQAVAELASVCGQSGDRVDYEKLAILMKSVGEVHKDFIAISREIDIIANPEPEVEEAPTGDTTNNILFTGTTAEMAEILKQLKK